MIFALRLSLNSLPVVWIFLLDVFAQSRRPKDFYVFYLSATTKSSLKHVHNSREEKFLCAWRNFFPKSLIFVHFFKVFLCLMLRFCLSQSFKSFFYLWMSEEYEKYCTTLRDEEICHTANRKGKLNCWDGTRPKLFSVLNDTARLKSCNRHLHSKRNSLSISIRVFIISCDLFVITLWKSKQRFRQMTSYFIICLLFATVWELETSISDAVKVIEDQWQPHGNPMK